MVSIHRPMGYEPIALTTVPLCYTSRKLIYHKLRKFSRETKHNTKHVAVWSSGMIPVLGTGGHGFNSRNRPLFSCSVTWMFSPSRCSVTWMFSPSRCDFVESQKEPAKSSPSGDSKIPMWRAELLSEATRKLPKSSLSVFLRRVYLRTVAEMTPFRIEPPPLTAFSIQRLF